MLNDRQEQVLRAVVDEYIRSGEPVASKVIVDRYVDTVSPATVRNDMAALEELGYVHQPHTSAGRVPTERGYKYYIDHFLRVERADRIAQELRDAVNRADSPQAMLRAAANALAQASGNAAIVAGEDAGSQMSGFANLMQHPEFDDTQRRMEVANALDRAEQAFAQLLELVSHEEVAVRIGRENPFGAELASVVIRVRLPNGEMGMLGLMGPLRMRYGRNIGLLQEVKKLLDRSFDDV